MSAAVRERLPAGAIDRSRRSASRSTACDYDGLRRRHARLGAARATACTSSAPSIYHGRPRGDLRGRRRGAERARAGRAGRRLGADAARDRGRAVRRAGGARRSPGRGALSPRRAIPRTTTRSTRTATCSWSAAGRPAWPRPSRPRTGARVILVDADRELGGASDAGRPRLGSRRSRRGSTPRAETCRCCRARPRSATTTTATSSLAERRTDHLGAAPPAGVPRERLWHVRARQVVLATGAHERPIVVRRQRPPGRHARRRRARPTSTATASLPGRARGRLHHERQSRTLDLRAIGHRARRSRDARSRRAGPPRADGRARRRARASRCRTTAWRTCDASCSPSSGGWNPAVHLLSQSQGTLRCDAVAGRLRARPRCRSGYAVAAAANGTLRPRGVPRGGRAPAAGARAATARAGARAATRRRTIVVGLVAPPATAQLGPSTSSTCSATRPSPTCGARLGAGLRSLEHVKRYTTIGTGHRPGQDVGRQRARHPRRRCSAADVADLGPTTFRPPYTPVSLRAARRPRPRRAAPTRSARPPIHAVARRARRGVRGRRPVEAAVVLPARRRGHGRRGAARVRGGARRRRR